MRTPLTGYYGGKTNMVKWLLSLLPSQDQYDTYVEVFGGSAALLFAKEPHGVEVYNDVDGSLVNFFRVLRDEKKYEKLVRLLYLTPYSREEFYYCRDHMDEGDDVERARRFFVVFGMSFSGNMRSWSYSVEKAYRNMSGVVSSYLTRIDRLLEAHQRIIRVQIEHDTFENVLKRYDTPRTFFYLDPPYHPDIRTDIVYHYEMSVDDHERLVNILLSLKGLVMLSGYINPVYAKLEERGWYRIDRTKLVSAGHKRKGDVRYRSTRIESVWLNYKPPIEEV